MAAQTKQNKKLKDFFKDKGVKPKARLKSLLAFVASVPEEEAKNFYKESYERIFGYMFERFQELENVEPAKKGKKHDKDVLTLLNITQQFLLFLPHLVKKRWEYSRFSEIIEKSLSRHNKQEIRLKALELLLLFIEILQTSIDDQKTLLANCIVLDPFYREMAPNKAPRPEQPSPTALCPAAGEPTIAEGVQLLDFFFDFIEKRESSFEYWWEMFKALFITRWYPSISVSMGLIDNNAVDERFSTHAPYPLQKCIIERIEKWADSQAICTVLWQTKNGPLMMELSRMTCQMPISYAGTIKKSMEVYRSFLMNQLQKNKFIGEHLQTYWRQFITNLSLVFFVKSTTEELAEHCTLCKEILSIYTYFSLELSKKMEVETWNTLQNTMLSTTHDLLAQAPSPNAPNTVAQEMSEAMFQSLYLFWIRSQTTTAAMWESFHLKVSQLVEWKATVSQWKEKLVQLTYILKDFFYIDSTAPAGSKGDKAPSSDGAASASDGTADGAGTAGADSPKSPKPAAAAPGPKKGTVVSKAGGEVQLRDTKLAAMPWDARSIEHIWFTVLRVLGNINKIQDPVNFHIAMTCVQDVVDWLMRAEDKLPINQPRPYNLFDIFLPWLLEGCAVEERRNAGRLVGYTVVCKLFCRIHPQPLPMKLLSHFYRVLRLGMTLGSHSVVWVIIRSAVNIFALALPGAAILIPDFLREIEYMFSPENKNPPPEDVQTKALTIVSTLTCYPSHFAGLDLPSIKSAELRSRISQVLLQAIRYSQATVAVVCTCIWALLVVVLEDLHSARPRKDVIGDCIRRITECCTLTPQHTEQVCKTAFDALSALYDTFGRFVAVDPSLVDYVIDTLCRNIVTMIEDRTNPLSGTPREEVVAGSFYCLLDLLLAAHHGNYDFSNELIDKVFDAVEYGLLGELLEPSAGGGELIDNSRKASVGPAAGAKLAKGESSAKLSAKLSGSADTLFDALKASPAHKSEVVREAAETFLLNMLNNYSNFPAISGTEQICAKTPLESFGSVKDLDNEVKNSNRIHFMYNALTIVSLEELEVDDDDYGAGRFVRLTVRDCTGKYSWETNIIYDYLQKKGTPNALPEPADSAKIPPVNPAKRLPVPKIDEPKFPRRHGELPLFSEAESRNVDMLAELLHFLHESHQEILPNERITFVSPLKPSEPYAKDITVTKETLNLEAVEEDQWLSTRREKRPPLPLRPPRPVPASHFHFCRLLLSHFGFLTPEHRRRFHFLENNQRFCRSVKELDKINGREVMKIGVLYVRDGQEDQKVIFRNDTASKLYMDFVRGLGWTVDLNTHTGFMGGMDRNASAGDNAPYYSTPTLEVIFHDITRMPTKENDPQQIHKKRHIGNDIVHIVWTEHRREYSPKTVTSQFNDVHIIIHPLSNGLFRIRIHHKPKVPPFGPLVDGMLLSKRLLPTLVRQTAINANRAVRFTKKEYKRPFPTRAALIKEIAQRYKTEKGFEEYLAKLFPLPTAEEKERLREKPFIMPGVSANTGDDDGAGEDASQKPVEVVEGEDE